MVAQSTTRHTGESTSEAAFRRQLDKVKSGVSIAEVASEHGVFKQTGAGRLLGRCLNPGHEDKSPSMQILTDSQTFRCYGCGEYGDVLDLVRLLEGCALFEAMGILASRYGIALESTRPQSWFDRQTRQKPLRDQMRHTQIEHIRMLVYRLIWVPWLKRLPEWVQDEAEESAWRDSLRMAELLYDQRRAA